VARSLEGGIEIRTELELVEPLVDARSRAVRDGLRARAAGGAGHPRPEG